MKTSLEQPGEKERTEARVTKEMKDLILKASLMEGRSTSDFVVASAFEAARETIRTRTTLELSVRDQIAFAESMIKQSSPNERLRKAADRYQEKRTRYEVLPTHWTTGWQKYREAKAKGVTNNGGSTQRRKSHHRGRRRGPTLDHPSIKHLGTLSVGYGPSRCSTGVG